MSKNQILSDVTVIKLILGGKGLGVAPDGKKVIIHGGCIPESVVDIRVLKNKKSYYEGQVLSVKKKSPLERPLPEGFQIYGGAKWLTIDYTAQLMIKEGQVREAFHQLESYVQGVRWHSLIPSPLLYGYRNKVEFSWGKYISDRENIHDDFRFGFHIQGQFDRIENCQFCALADDEVNAIFHTIDTLSRQSGFPTYDPKQAQGFWRHLVIRKPKLDGEIMIMFSINAVWNQVRADEPGTHEAFFQEMNKELVKMYPRITSIYFLENTDKADIVQGNPVLLFGNKSINADLLGLTFEIQPKSFFQVNTLGAEKLYQKVIDLIEGKGGILLDLYAGTGTLGILLSDCFSHVYSVEVVSDASKDAQKNAERNKKTNIDFVCKKTEDFALDFSQQSGKADVIIIDPPRDGMALRGIYNILSFGAREILYVSCNPATLSRDLEVFVGKNRNEHVRGLPRYAITDIVPVDMFPHTPHIETIVRMCLQNQGE